MNLTKSFSRRSLFWILLMMLLPALLFTAAGIYGRQFFFSVLPLSLIQEASVHSEACKTGLEKILPVVTGIFLVYGLLLWIILRSMFVRLIRKSGLEMIPEKKKLKTEKTEKSAHSRDITPELDKQVMIETHKRFYLHLLSVLQRDGRLIDFFSEDLSRYEDAQIGAAVRSIQENCKHSLKKYLKPKAVVDKNEGESIEVPSGFDPDTIKLTGKVTGEPPFQGILRHKGWRASKLELPTLSSVRDPNIIAPAEVEIL